MKNYWFGLISFVTFLSVTVSMESMESTEIEESEHDIWTNCMRQEGVTNEDVKAAVKSGKYHQLNCLHSCILTEVGLMRDGKFKAKALGDFLKIHVSDIKKKMMKCAQKVSTEHHERCDVPLEIYNCLNAGDEEGELLL